MSKKFLRVVLAGMFISVVARSALAEPQLGVEDGTPMQPFTGQPESELRAEDVLAPPLSGNLVPVRLEIPAYPYRVFVDADSLQPVKGASVRYGVLLRTASGSETRFFEELRCDTREFRTILYGLSDGSWARFPSNKWQPVRDSGAWRYRDAFFHGIMCDETNGAWSRREILRRLRTGSDDTGDE